MDRMNWLFFIPIAFAQDTILPRTGPLVEKLRTGTISITDIPDFILYLIKFLIGVAGIITFIMILVGGYYYIIGGVYTELKEKGKSTLSSAIIGFILALMAYGIVDVIQKAVTS